MKIGIISDTHGNIENQEKVVDWLTKKQKIDRLYHLGDDYDDIARLGDYYLEIVQVPGIYDERYKNKSLPAKVFETILGLNILLVHVLEKDATKDDIMRSDIILHGHTHKEEIRLDNGRLYINPGHIKGPLDKNMPPTFAMMTLFDRSISVAIYGLDFKPIRTMELMRAESGLYKT